MAGLALDSSLGITAMGPQGFEWPALQLFRQINGDTFHNSPTALQAVSILHYILLYHRLFAATLSYFLFYRLRL